MGHCYNSTILSAPIETVWETINDFHQLSWGEPVINKVEKVGDLSGEQIGAKRILNNAFHETLLSLSPNTYEFSYRIDDGPGPVAKDAVTNYIGRVKLSPVTDSNETFIEWSSAFESSSDSEVSDFCNPIYIGLLAALKSHF